MREHRSILSLCPTNRNTRICKVHAVHINVLATYTWQLV